jgi:hypothetical protein
MSSFTCFAELPPELHVHIIHDAWSHILLHRRTTTAITISWQAIEWSRCSASTLMKVNKLFRSEVQRLMRGTKGSFIPSIRKDATESGKQHVMYFDRETDMLEVDLHKMPYSPYQGLDGRLSPIYQHCGYCRLILHIYAPIDLLTPSLCHNLTSLRLRLDHALYYNLMLDHGGEMVDSLMYDVLRRQFPAVKRVELVEVRRWELGSTERIMERFYKRVVDYEIDVDGSMRFEIFWQGYESE